MERRTAFSEQISKGDIEAKRQARNEEIDAVVAEFLEMMRLASLEPKPELSIDEISLHVEKGTGPRAFELVATWPTESKRFPLAIADLVQDSQQLVSAHLPKLRAATLAVRSRL